MTNYSTELSNLLSIRELYRDSKQTVVFTNGCFDLLHPGHLTYLEEAKVLGDILIVGLNSDDSAKTLKGPERPINPEYDRFKLLLGLKPVDHVILFDELTPIQLIETLQPDIHVKGGDYTPNTLPEYPTITAYGGRVEIVSFVDGYSSSNIITKIQSL